MSLISNTKRCKKICQIISAAERLRKEKIRKKDYSILLIRKAELININ